MNHPYDTIELNNGAKLIFTPCPGTRNTSLTAAVETLAQAGTTALVTAMPLEELALNGVDALPQVSQSLGIKWIHLPVEDDKSPEQLFTTQLQQHKAGLLGLIKDKATIAIHCKGGSGRTGLIAAVLLLESGENWQNVKSQIQSIRPKALTLAVHLDFLSANYSL
ncbi:MAG: protein phosphatase [Methylophaga sp.]